MCEQENAGHAARKRLRTGNQVRLVEEPRAPGAGITLHVVPQATSG